MALIFMGRMIKHTNTTQGEICKNSGLMEEGITMIKWSEKDS